MNLDCIMLKIFSQNYFVKESKEYRFKNVHRHNYLRNNAVNEYIFHVENTVKSLVKHSYHTLKVK